MSYAKRGGRYVLTTVEKRRILQNNIYGVDLDQNAVEVSKLSLLLKMLENEDGSDATGLQTVMFSAGEPHPARPQRQHSNGATRSSAATSTAASR